MSHKTRNPYFQPVPSGNGASLLRTVLHTPSLFLLMALVLQIALMTFQNSTFIDTALQIIVIFSAIGVAANTRRHFYLGLVLATTGTALLIFGRATRQEPFTWAGYVLFLLLYLHVIRLMLKQLFHTQVVTIATIGTALCTYVLLGSLWMLFYVPLAAIDPNAFNISWATEGRNLTTTLTYFSYVTLTTLGYGDVLPVSPLARSLAILEALTGTLFLAVLISRLVGTYGRTSRDMSEPTGRTDGD